MTTIEPAQQVFALFYAIMWGTLANVWPRLKPFDWAQAFHPDHRKVTLRRCFLSLVMLNILPILLFVVVFIWLGSWKLDGTWPRLGTKLAIVMVQPFALIGFYWVWTAIIQRFKQGFYPDDESLYPDLDPNIDLDPKMARPNLIVGLIYACGPLLALLIAWLLMR